MIRRLAKIRMFILVTLTFAGLAAIAFSLYHQYVLPNLHENSLEKLDLIRIADLDTLNKAVTDAISASTTAPVGKNNIIYISLTSATSTCSNLELPSVPNGWSYHCATTSTLRNTDGTGWLPINLKDSLSQLPIDPLNSEKSLNYYSYVASTTVIVETVATSTATSTATFKPTSIKSKTTAKKVTVPKVVNLIKVVPREIPPPQFVITGVLDSGKYLKEKARDDEGMDNTRYEIGNSLKIWKNAFGLLGWWPMEVKENKVVDRSENNNDGKIIGDIKDAKVANKKALSFNATDGTYIDMGQKITEQLASSTFSFLVRFRSNSDIGEDGVVGGIYGGNYKGFLIRQENTGSITFLIGQGNKMTTSLSITSEKDVWNQAVLTYDGKIAKAYVNGNKMKKIELDTIDNNSGRNLIIGRNSWDETRQFTGDINETMIFNRALSEQEVANLYGEFSK